MKTITLRYNERSKVARQAIEFLLSAGIAEPAEEPANRFAESDDDIENGRVYEAKDAGDLLRKCLAN